MLSAKQFFGGTFRRTAGMSGNLSLGQGRVQVIAGAPSSTLTLPSRAGLMTGGPYLFLINTSGSTLSLHDDTGATIASMGNNTQTTVLLTDAGWRSFTVSLSAAKSLSASGAFGGTSAAAAPPGLGDPPVDTCTIPPTTTRCVVGSFTTCPLSCLAFDWMGMPFVMTFKNTDPPYGSDLSLAGNWFGRFVRPAPIQAGSGIIIGTPPAGSSSGTPDGGIITPNDIAFDGTVWPEWIFEATMTCTLTGWNIFVIETVGADITHVGTNFALTSTQICPPSGGVFTQVDNFPPSGIPHTIRLA